MKKNKIVPNITYKSVLSGYKNIENRNKAFNALDKQSQRMEIAWDMLNLVCGGKLKAAGKGGNGDSFYWSENLQKISCKTPAAFQEKLLKKLPNCEVCARGGMMLSQIRLGNTLPDFIKSEAEGYKIDMGEEKILKGFSMRDFTNMEAEYERCSFLHPYSDNTEEKLANICCNILVNGNFDVSDTTDYLIIK